MEGARPTRINRLKANTKATGTKAKPVKPFPFFNLPRELRDRIYRVALVTHNVDIQLAVCVSDDDDAEYAEDHPDPKLRTTFISSGRKMTYRLNAAPKCDCVHCYGEPEAQFNLFLANRQVYEESREVFYTQNRFSILLSSGIGFLSFLKDRRNALKYIRHISFDIPTHTADWCYSRFSNKAYTELFKMLKEETGLRQLNVNIHGLVPDVTKDQWKCCCDCAVFEHPLLALGNAFDMPGAPLLRTKKVHKAEWALFRALSEVNNLLRLSINIDYCHHMLDHDSHDEAIFDHDHIREFINYMRSRMLKNGDKLGNNQIHSYCRGGNIDDKRYRFHSDDDEYGVSRLGPLKLNEHRAMAHVHEDSGSDLDSEMPDLGVSDDDWEDEDGDNGEFDNGDDSMSSLEDSYDDDDDDNGGRTFFSISQHMNSFLPADIPIPDMD